MAEGKKSFILYCDWWDWIECLTQEQKAKWVDWLFAYVRDLKPEMPKDQALMMVCKYTKQQLKEDLVKYENKVKSIENARKSNRNHTENKLKSNSNQLEINSVNVNDNVNVNVNDNVCVNTHNNNACACEEENINTLQSLIQEIETLFNRCLTNAEATTIREFKEKGFTDESIIRDLGVYADKQNPIAYMKKMIENAKIQEKVYKEETPPQEEISGSEWLDNFKKEMGW